VVVVVVAYGCQEAEIGKDNMKEEKIKHSK